MQSVALLSGAALLLEGALLRLLAVAQFYHFAFLVVSLALLGFGASGSLLSLWPPAKPEELPKTLGRVSFGFVLALGLGYAIVNWIPFDSYSIAWDRRQILFFGLYYLALTLPFLLAGLGIGAALASAGRSSNLVYGANLLGSAGGALIAPLALGVAGVPGAVLLSALIGMLAARSAAQKWTRWGLHALLLAGLLFFAALGLLNLRGEAILGMTLSPYKGLSDARRYPGAQFPLSRWNAISRLDLVAEAGIRQLPGLSYLYTGSLPPQLGLATDGENPQAITAAAPDQFEAAPFLPEAIAFSLQPAGRVLVLEPGGGLGILQALAGGAAELTAVESNPLVSAMVDQAVPGQSPFARPGVETISSPVRPFLARADERFEVIFMPLTDRFRPVTSGAFSLTETYGLTVEAFEATLDRLSLGGLLVVSRWLQTPPSECLRLVATLAEALAGRGVRGREALVVYRGIQTVTVLVRPSGWDASDLDQIRDFLAARKYDLVWAPDIRPEETNRFNRLPEPIYFQAVQALLEGPDRRQYYAEYAFDIRPPTDDRPFFFHFFRWEQTPQVIATLGMTWQPFGGSGYFVLIALLGLVLLLSLVLILLPVMLGRRRHRAAPRDPGHLRVLLYFSLLGLAFLLVEIPLIQRWILYLGHPIYAFVAVVPTVLAFSGLGSALARQSWLPRRTCFLLLAGLVLLAALALPPAMQIALGWPIASRLLLTALFLAPLGFLMGLPFPWGLQWLESRAPGLVPWAWAVNGCASVVASVLAAILSMGYGFTVVIVLGGLCYAAALGLLPERETGS